MNSPTNAAAVGDPKKPAAEAPTQAAFVEKSEADLKEWSRRLEKLAAQAEKLTAEAKTAAQKGIGELRPKLAAARQRLDASRSVASEKWLDAKSGVESIWGEVKALFEKHDAKPAA
jgi:hypothetical protein